MNFLFNFLRNSIFKGSIKGEELICVKFANYVREMTLTGRCKHVWFHVSNEGSANNKQSWGARQRNMGKFAGVSDYIFVGQHSSLALEVKNGKKTLHPSQKDFKAWCLVANVPYEVAYSLEEAIAILNKYKIVLSPEVVHKSVDKTTKSSVTKDLITMLN